MISRHELEKPRTPMEMKSLITAIAMNRDSIPDRDYHRRKGVLKDLLEEYVFLQSLAEHVAPDCKAHLTTESNQGPDGEIVLASGQIIKIQITVADQGHQAAMGRERLSEGHITFPLAKKERNPTTKAVEERGRIVTTRRAQLRKQVEMTEQAIQRKTCNYHNGTDILLVGVNIFLSDEDLDYSWKEDLRARIVAINPPFPKICIDTGKKIFEAYP